LLAINRGGDFRQDVFEQMLRLPVSYYDRARNADLIVKLTWAAFANGLYRVEYLPALTDSRWLTIGPGVTAAGNTISITNNLAGDAQRFYRVRLLP